MQYSLGKIFESIKNKITYTHHLEVSNVNFILHLLSFFHTYGRSFSPINPRVYHIYLSTWILHFIYTEYILTALSLNSLICDFRIILILHIESYAKPGNDQCFNFYLKCFIPTSFKALQIIYFKNCKINLWYLTSQGLSSAICLVIFGGRDNVDM